MNTLFCEDFSNIKLLENVRYMNLVTYACDHDIDLCLKNHVKQIEGAYRVRHEEEDTESHTHICLWLKYPRRSSTIKTWFKHCMDEKNEYANTLVEHCYDCGASYRYLMHLDHPEKRQYEESDVIVFGAPVEEYVKQKTQYKIKDDASRNKEAAHDRVDCLIKELIDGMPFQMLIKVYGRDFIINYRHYCSTACICCLERYDLKNAKRLANYSGNVALIDMVNQLTISGDFTDIEAVDPDEIYQLELEENKKQKDDLSYMFGYHTNI